MVRFSAQVGDADGDVDNLGYVWAFGDGSFSAEKNPVHTYTAAGVYTASLTVTDARGGKTTKTVQITVTSVAGAAPAAKAPDAAPAQASWFGVSEPVKTSVSGFAKSGLTVKVTATEAMSGSAKLLVSSKVAKALGLKSTTLATAKVSFTNAGSKSVKFKVSSKVEEGPGQGQGLGQGHPLREPEGSGRGDQELHPRGHADAQVVTTARPVCAMAAALGQGGRLRAFWRETNSSTT